MSLPNSAAQSSVLQWPNKGELGQIFGAPVDVSEKMFKWKKALKKGKREGKDRGKGERHFLIPTCDPDSHVRKCVRGGSAYA